MVVGGGGLLGLIKVSGFLISKIMLAGMKMLLT